MKHWLYIVYEYLEKKNVFTLPDHIHEVHFLNDLPLYKKKVCITFFLSIYNLMKFKSNNFMTLKLLKVVFSRKMHSDVFHYEKKIFNFSIKTLLIMYLLLLITMKKKHAYHSIHS